MYLTSCKNEGLTTLIFFLLVGLQLPQNWYDYCFLSNYLLEIILYAFDKATFLFSMKHQIFSKKFLQIEYFNTFLLKNNSRH